VVKVTAAATTALAAQDVTVPAEAATGRVIAELATGLDRYCERRDALAAEIEERSWPTLPVSCWHRCQRSGPRTGARVLAEIGDGLAFTTGGKLAAYTGLALTEAA